MQPERKDGKKAREERAGQTPASMPESNQTAEEYASYPEGEVERDADAEARREADPQPAEEQRPEHRVGETREESG